jgi:hypothetical protein
VALDAQHAADGQGALNAPPFKERPRKRSAAMKRSGEWRSSMLTARSFAKL